MGFNEVTKKENPMLTYNNKLQLVNGAAFLAVVGLGFWLGYSIELVKPF